MDPKHDFHLNLQRENVAKRLVIGIDQPSAVHFECRSINWQLTSRPVRDLDLFKMVSSLQSIVLYSIPVAVLFDLFKTLWGLPMGKECRRALFRRCTL